MSTESANDLQRIIDFEPLIKRSLQGFVGRQWVRDEVSAFLCQPTPRYFLILGEPGSGKTSVMADLVHRCGYPHHFIGKGSQTEVEGSPEWWNPVRFAESIGYQLVRDCGGWAMPWDQYGIVVDQEVRHLEGRLIGADISVFSAIPRPFNAPVVSVRQTVEQMGKVAQAIGVRVQELHMDVEQIVQLLLIEPLKRLAKQWPQDKIVVVIDGLDEAQYSDPKHSILNWLSGDSRPGSELPQNVRFLVSARPTLNLSEEFRRQAYTLWLSKDPDDHWRSEDIQGDAIEFAKHLVTENIDVNRALNARAVTVQDFAEKVATASEGNFLYLYYYKKGLLLGLQQGDQSLLDLATLPAGLAGIYNDFLGKIRLQVGDYAWIHDYKPVLGTLAVAHEPLSVQQVARFAGVTEDTSGAVRTRLTEFLDPAAQQRFTLYHRSFAEFLVSKDNLDPVSAAAAHGRIADAYLPADFEAPWENWDAYGWRFVSSHLSEAALHSMDPVEKHKRTERLTTLVLDHEFQHSERDTFALLDALRLAVYTAARDGVRPALPILVNSACELIAVRRRLLNPEDVFAAAEHGDLKEAERRLGFFALDKRWHQAARLIIALVAAPVRPDDAKDLRNRVGAELQVQQDPALQTLSNHVHASLDGPPIIANPLDKLPEPHEIRAAINLMAGVKDPKGNMVRRLSAEEMEGASGYAASCELITADAAGMAAFAAKFNDDNATYVDEYLNVLTRNTYVQYRNGFLFAFLGGLVQQANHDWIRPRARRIAIAALGGNTLEFEDGLGLASQVLRANAKLPGASEHLESTIGCILAEATKAAQQQDDLWSIHLRRLTALGECLGYTKQHQDVASQCLKDAFCLWRGFAGFRAPACLTLAEAIHITKLPPGNYRELASNEALAAAHNIQEAVFCAQTTSRINAMMRQWKTVAPDKIDPLVRRFCADPHAPEFAPIHVGGERYDQRNTYEERTPLPNVVRNARSLLDLATNVYKQPPAELLRLNTALHPDWEVTTQLKDDGTVEVRIPDPDFAPLLAARLAAEVLAERALPPHVRVELIRLLVPVALSNPTALDTILMRLLLAASYWLDEPTLQKITSLS